jgi:hypothetical protein
LLIPVMARDESSMSDLDIGNLRSGRQNREEKTEEASTKTASSNEDLARTLTFNLPTAPGGGILQLPTLSPAQRIFKEPLVQPDPDPNEPCSTLACISENHKPNPGTRPSRSEKSNPQRDDASSYAAPSPSPSSYEAPSPSPSALATLSAPTSSPGTSGEIFKRSSPSP